MAKDDAVDFHALDAPARLDFALRYPDAFFITGEDNLQLTAISSVSTLSLTMSGRFMQLNGQITPFSYTMSIVGDRIAQTFQRALGNGWILNLVIYPSVGTPLIGQCWAAVQVVRGLGGALTTLAQLVSGYVTRVQPIAFPKGVIRDTLDGQGVIRSVTGTNPAAGADWSATVPTGARWRLNTLIAILTTDATVIVRFPLLIIDDGANVVWRSDPPASQAAGAAFSYSAGAGISRAVNIDTTPMWPLPNDLVLLAGYRIRSATGNLQAGDDWGAPQLLVEEWLEGI